MSTELTTNVQPRGLALSTFDDHYRFAGLVAKSDFAPKDFKGKPESCMLAICHGAEIGLSPMQSLQSIAVVNGRPSVYGDTALAVCKGSPACEWVRETIEGDGESMTAVCTAKRRGDAEPTVARFSVADAKKAGLWGKAGPWTQYPRRMLQMRARGFALRDAFPDILRGLVTAEEAQDYTHTEPVAVPPTPQPKPVTATQADIEKARNVINSAKSKSECERFKVLVNSRKDMGFYTIDEAGELLNLLDDQLELVTTQPEEVPA
jgi:hypothetical protein